MMIMKKTGLFTVLALLVACSSSQAQAPTFLGGTGVSNPVTISGLPAASAKGKHLAIVTDGQSTTDCTSAGGGTDIVLCCDNGTAWAACGSGGSGGGGSCTVAGTFLRADGTCVDVLEEAELNTFTKWLTQVVVGGTCNSGTFVRGDGQCVTPAGAGTILQVGDCSTGICFGAADLSNQLAFEGLTDNAFEGLLVGADFTADRALTIPDESGTICTNNSICSGTAVYEQDTHATEHSFANSDPISIENLKTACVQNHGAIAGSGGALVCTPGAVIQGSVAAFDNRLVRTNGTGSLTVQNTGITVDDTDNMNMNAGAITNADSITLNCVSGSNNCITTFTDNAATTVVAPSAGDTSVFTSGGEVYKQDPSDASGIQLLDTDDKTGTDAKVVSGTAGATGAVMVWNSNDAGTSVATDDALLIGNGTVHETKVIPNCLDTGGNHLNYTQSTNTVSCGTSGGGGGNSESRMYQEAFGIFNVSNIDATIQGNAQNAVQVPIAATLDHMTITCVTSTGGAQPLTCTTDPCLTAELYVNGTDKLSQDCNINTGTNSCIQALTSNNTLTAGQRMNVRYSSASDAAPTSADCIFALWGSLD